MRAPAAEDSAVSLGLLLLNVAVRAGLGVDDILNWKVQNQKEEERITRASKGALIGRAAQQRGGRK